MRTYSRTFPNWTLRNNDTINITEIHSKGNDLDDLLANCEIYAQDWHGNPVEVVSWDLAGPDFADLEREFAEFLSIGSYEDAFS